MQRVDRVHRSYHKQDRWLYSGPYREPVRINWKELAEDAFWGLSIAIAGIAVLFNVMGVC